MDCIEMRDPGWPRVWAEALPLPLEITLYIIEIELDMIHEELLSELEDISDFFGRSNSYVCDGNEWWNERLQSLDRYSDAIRRLFDSKNPHMYFLVEGICTKHRRAFFDHWWSFWVTVRDWDSRHADSRHHARLARYREAWEEGKDLMREADRGLTEAGSVPEEDLDCSDCSGHEASGEGDEASEEGEASEARGDTVDEQQSP